jgi:threonylcarbamoyladenosine tRNA methylthiotransferase MtaB
MAGFPGETEAEFEESRRFIESLPFTYLHVFTYSERPGTPAASAPQVPVRARRDRNRVLREIAAAKNLAFRESMIGRRLRAVTIDGGRSALSSNYLKVELAHRREENRLIDVPIGGTGPGTVRECTPFPVLKS